MSMTDLPVLRALKEKLRFHEQRQKVLAENVANASTPGFVGRDMKSPDFFRMVAQTDRTPSVRLVSTDAKHMAGQPAGPAGVVKGQKQTAYETQPDGNAVSLEEQMMKVTDNQMDFQVASALYQRGLGLIKTAIGKK